MKREVKFIASYKDGLKVVDYISFVRTAKSYHGNNFLLIIEPIKNPRTIKQNAYYWGGVLGVLSNDLGYTPEEIHRLLKTMFLSKKKAIVGIDKDGKKHTEEIDSIKSTTELSTEEFGDYIDKIRYWAIDFNNSYIPTPDEYFENCGKLVDDKLKPE